MRSDGGCWLAVVVAQDEVPLHATCVRSGCRAHTRRRRGVPHQPEQPGALLRPLLYRRQMGPPIAQEPIIYGISPVDQKIMASASAQHSIEGSPAGGQETASGVLCIGDRQHLETK